MAVGQVCEKVMQEIYVMFSHLFKPVPNREVKNVSVSVEQKRSTVCCLKQKHHRLN
jgi:hypothetical protein